eukprot:scaffold10067_cov67-Phaeocystis_antarctica.AAC.5
MRSCRAADARKSWCACVMLVTTRSSLSVRKPWVPFTRSRRLRADAGVPSGVSIRVALRHKFLKSRSTRPRRLALNTTMTMSNASKAPGPLHLARLESRDSADGTKSGA